MSHIYYVLYDATTLTPYSVSGSPFDLVPEGSSTCKVYEPDGEDFHTGKKIMRDFIVQINSDGYAVFKYTHLHIVSIRSIVNSDVIQDLNYKIIFFNYLNIKYQQSNNAITLFFDLDKIAEEYRDNFNLTVTNGGACILYITRYQDPTALIKTDKIDLLELSKLKTFTILLDYDEKISVWATKE